MILKSSVIHQGVQPPIWYACGVADMVYRFNGLKLIITSMTDSHENRPSLHNKGLAVDLRTRHVPPELLKTVHGSLSNVLSPIGFDVILESDHLHIEYDPKGQENWRVRDTQII